jgi:hypothetical protein
MIHRYLSPLSVLLALGLASISAAAGTVSYVASVPLQSTNWSTTLSIPKFNAGTGVLASVTVEVRDSLVHEVQFENTSPSSSSTFSDSTYATVDVLRPASTSLVTAIAKYYKTATVGVFDGTIDYAGTSGVTFGGLVDYVMSTSTTTAASDLALFSGTGNIDLPCQAVAYFRFGYSGGNAHYSLSTQAAAYVVVTYTYTNSTAAQTTSWGRIKSLYR